MATTSVFDSAALPMISELEKAAICDVVKELIGQQISVSAPEEFFQPVSLSLSASRNFTRSPAEVRFIYNSCHKSDKSLPNVQSYVQNSKRQVERQREGMEKVEWPQAPPDPMMDSNYELASKALEAFQQGQGQQQGAEGGGGEVMQGEGEEVKWEMTMPVLGGRKDGGK